ncbi:hypothetical protein AC249_AIPGENE11019 [Exaiptasia diaphana]|nr:hypothetical protein AC249_AIPGENE11019 [Exaiptasia diaphana]
MDFSAFETLESFEQFIFNNEIPSELVPAAVDRLMELTLTPEVDSETPDEKDKALQELVDSCLEQDTIFEDVSKFVDKCDELLEMVYHLRAELQSDRNTMSQSNHSEEDDLSSDSIHTDTSEESSEENSDSSDVDSIEEQEDIDVWARIQHQVMDGYQQEYEVLVQKYKQNGVTNQAAEISANNALLQSYSRDSSFGNYTSLNLRMLVSLQRTTKRLTAEVIEEDSGKQYRKLSSLTIFMSCSELLS